MPETALPLGGSAKAIEHHYDVGNDFFATWLDPTMTYSCAMWDGIDPEAPLEEAQHRKLRYHADMARVAKGDRVLDVGCGWGGMMRSLVDNHGVNECVGLTLSRQQAAHIRAFSDPRIDVREVNWSQYAPDKPFDAVISIGAFEHFTQPDQTVQERRAVYRSFFESCREWTDGKGNLSLQTIAYASMTPDQSNPFITGEIFPEAELPTLEDIVVASSGLFHLSRLRDDAMDYARTCELWARNLRMEAKRGAVSAPDELVQKYYRYLRISAVGFRMRKISLLRLAFEPLGWNGARQT